MAKDIWEFLGLSGPDIVHDNLQNKISYKFRRSKGRVNKKRKNITKLKSPFKQCNHKVGVFEREFQRGE